MWFSGIAIAVMKFQKGFKWAMIIGELFPQKLLVWNNLAGENTYLDYVLEKLNFQSRLHNGLCT